MPVAYMNLKMQGIISGEPNTELPKYILYSAHDDSVLNLLRFLGIDFDWIPFASTVTIELKYSEKLVRQAGSKNPERFFGVSVLRDGVP